MKNLVALTAVLLFVSIAGPPTRADEFETLFSHPELTVAPGFVVEEVYEVPKETEGSWVALTIDDAGRLIAGDQGKQGLFRITLNDADEPQIEKLPVDLSGAQGLLSKSGKLYASITGAGMYAIIDSNGDGALDKAELLSSYHGRGEHGNHALVDAEDSEAIYTVSGNGTPLPSPDSIVRRRNPSWQEDLLLPRQWDPRGHAAGDLAPGGWITKFDPRTRTHDVFCTGFRNQYDVTLNGHGDLFTFDADMEWDLGLPWYRPTRICLAVSGGEYGWRSGSGKWKTYYEDTLPPLVDIGPGSPTGMISGRGARFPAKYQRAIFALDWTYGRILAVHLKPEGAGYQAEVEDFVFGPALPVTDAVIGVDGALYFTTGGRGTQSHLFRVAYVGNEPTDAAPIEPLPKEGRLRRDLAAFHGVESPQAIAAAWPHLFSPDRFLRYAARVAVESQPLDTWADKVFAESDPQARITASVALARMGTNEQREKLLRRLGEFEFSSLPVSQQLGVLRAYDLTLARLEKVSDDLRQLLVARLDPVLPSEDFRVNSELLKILVFLQAPSAAAKGIDLVERYKAAEPVSWGGIEKLNPRYGNTLKRITENPPPTDAIEIAFALRNLREGWTLPLRRAYFAFLNEAAKASGGASYPGYLTNIRDEALATCADETRVALADLTGENFNPVPDFPVEPPVGPGRKWTVEDALAATGSMNPRQLSFERGRSLFHSVSCGACHRFSGLGGGVGPDLTSVPNKFTKEYLIEAIIDPSKNISDQYQSQNVLLSDGRLLSGIVVEQDSETMLIYSSDPKAEPHRISPDEIEEIRPSDVSQMPAELLDQMNPGELRDLVGYILSGGDAEHKLYRVRR